jgi:TRAP-type transport system periplasmic protein
MNRIHVVAATAAALAMSLQAASMARAETLTLSFSAFSGSANPNHRMVIDKMVEDIQKASNGKVKFETYFGGTGFGQPQRQFEQVQRGVVDIANGLFGYTPGRFPMTEIVELPFLYDDAIAASRALWLTQGKYLKQEYPGVHPIALWLTAVQQLHTRQPVNKLEELKGLKIRAGGPSMVNALKQLNAEGIIVPAPQIYERLQKGVIDGSIGAWGMLRAFKVGEVTSHHLKVDITAAPLFIFMNQAKYDGLPADVKALFDAYSNPDTAAKFSGAFHVTDKPGLEIAQSSGHTMTALSASERARWQKQVQPVIDTYLQGLEAKGMKAKDFYRDFLAEYERQKTAGTKAN